MRLVCVSSLTFLAACASGPLPAGCQVAPELGSDLQAALDGAESGDVVCLAEGDWDGGLTLSRAVILRGLGAAVLSGGAPVVRVDADSAVLVDLIIADGEAAADGEGAGVQVGEGAAFTMVGGVLRDHAGPGLLGIDMTSLLVSNVEVYGTSPGGTMPALGGTADTVDVSDLHVHENDGNGLVLVADDVVVTNAWVEANTGVGLVVSGGTVSVSDSTLVGNRAGGAMAQGVEAMTVVGGSFSGNTGAAGLFAEEVDSLTLDGVAFTANAATDGSWAGGLDVQTSGDVLVQGCFFEGNSAVDPLSGGGLSVASSDALEVVDSTFTGNLAAYSGGGASAFVVDAVTVRGSSFTGNTAFQGGALALANVGAGVSEGNFFDANVAEAGGALALYSGSLGGADAGVALSASGDHFASNASTLGEAYGPDIGCVASSYVGTSIVFEQDTEIFAEACEVELL